MDGPGALRAVRTKAAADAQSEWETLVPIVRKRDERAAGAKGATAEAATPASCSETPPSSAENRSDQSKGSAEQQKKAAIQAAAPPPPPPVATEPQAPRADEEAADGIAAAEHHAPHAPEANNNIDTAAAAAATVEGEEEILAAPSSHPQQQQEEGGQNTADTAAAASLDDGDDAAAAAAASTGAPSPQQAYVSPHERRRRAKVLADRKDRYIRQGGFLRRLLGSTAATSATSQHAHLEAAATSLGIPSSPLALATGEAAMRSAVRLTLAFLADVLRHSAESIKTPSPTLGSHSIASRVLSGPPPAIAHIQEVLGFDAKAAASAAHSTMTRLLARSRQESDRQHQRLAIAVVSLRPICAFADGRAAAKAKPPADALLAPLTEIDVSFGGGMVLNVINVGSDGEDDIEVVATLPTLRVRAGADGSLSDTTVYWTGRCLLQARKVRAGTWTRQQQQQEEELQPQPQDRHPAEASPDLLHVADLAFAEDRSVTGTLDAVLTTAPATDASSPPPVAGTAHLGTFEGRYDTEVRYTPACCRVGGGGGGRAAADVGALLEPPSPALDPDADSASTCCFDAALDGPPGAPVVGRINLEGLGPVETPGLWVCVHDAILALAARGAKGGALPDDSGDGDAPLLRNAPLLPSSDGADPRAASGLARALGKLSFENAFGGFRRTTAVAKKAAPRPRARGLLELLRGERASASDASDGADDDNVFEKIPPSVACTKVHGPGSSSMRRMAYQLSYVVAE